MRGAASRHGQLCAACPWPSAGPSLPAAFAWPAVATAFLSARRVRSVLEAMTGPQKCDRTRGNTRHDSPHTSRAHAHIRALPCNKRTCEIRGQPLFAPASQPLSGQAPYQGREGRRIGCLSGHRNVLRGDGPRSSRQVATQDGSGLAHERRDRLRWPAMDPTEPSPRPRP